MWDWRLTLFMSTPMTLPVSPTLLAARKASKPAPLPRSITVSPCKFLSAKPTRHCRAYPASRLAWHAGAALLQRTSRMLARAIGFPQLRPRLDS